MQTSSLITSTEYLVVFVAFSIVHCAPADWDMWKKNLDQTSAFACKEPRRRAFDARRLLAGRVDQSETVLPHVAVLRRCGNNSGCCNDAYEACGVAKKARVRLVFLVHSKAKGLRYEVYEGRNHKTCRCKRVGR